MKDGLIGWPLLGYAPGSYFCKCRDCRQEYEGDKRSFQCLACAVKAANEQLGRIVGLETEIQAAKDFGGGFYGEAVQEATQRFYKDAVLRRKNDEIMVAFRALQSKPEGDVR